MFNQPNQRYKTGFLPDSPVVRYLIFICSGLFLFEFMVQTDFFDNFGVLYLQSIFEKAQVWRLITFQFLHADFSHVIGNMIGLYFFGPILERWLGWKRFLAYYLLCGVFGGVLFLFYSQYYAFDFRGLVGASGGLYGILVGVAFLNPQLRVRMLFLPFQISMKQLAWGLLGIAAFTTLINGRNAGGEACHLGGAILGYLLMKKPNWLAVFEGSTGFSNQGSRRNQKAYSAKIKPRTSVDLNHDTEVDRILDKISKQGLHSISDEEREFLNQFSKKE